MNSILKKDFSIINDTQFIDWDKIDDHSFLITGATGLLGKLIVMFFQYRNHYFNSNIKMFLVVRDKNKAIQLFGNDKNIEYIVTSIDELDEYLNLNIDYIIHGASPTSSKFFVNNPVETLNTLFIGTQKILDIAHNNRCKSIVFLSSMEMYGVLSNKNVMEDNLGYINNLDIRSSYSEGKRVCELLCYSYMSEYHVPVKICRLSQTFGMGINKNENRVFKQFCESIINNRDIVLKSNGETIINYTYTTDSITAIFKILLDGQNGEAYNVVNDDDIITIKDIATWLVENKSINNKVIFDIDKNAGFAPTNKMKLSNYKLKKIGWVPIFSVYEGYERLLEFMKYVKNK